MNKPPSGSFRSLKDCRPEMVERNTAEPAELVSTETEPVGLVTGMDRTGPMSPVKLDDCTKRKLPSDDLPRQATFRPDDLGTPFSRRES